jgi:predicted nucleotidyltransferase component of viral defense system
MLLIETGVKIVYYQIMHSIRELVECFHLIFLDHLGRKIDKRLYVLKGGCNLRFYFRSIRYSEDIDFDVAIINQETLRKNVNNILAAQSLIKILHTKEITITNISLPKQTETTQRWKISLTNTNLGLTAHTKIEFSRRNKKDAALFEAIDNNIIHHYHLSPIFLSHYNREAAIAQKIIALADRSVTQARDIFDLYLLLGNKTLEINFILTKEQITKATENMKTIKFQDFQSQVVSYLTNEYKKTYASPEIWQQITTEVERFIGAKRK